MLSYLISQAPDSVNDLDEDGMTSLHLAASSRHLKCVGALIDAVADPKLCRLDDFQTYVVKLALSMD